jgi:hypothetical protein
MAIDPPVPVEEVPKLAGNREVSVPELMEKAWRSGLPA